VPTILGGWQYVPRALITACVVFVITLIVLRIGGKRVLAKMNVFDFIFSVAIGTTMAGVILQHDAGILEATVGVATLTAMQILFAVLTTHSPRMDRVINGRPTLLFRAGKFLHRELHKQRISQEELLAAMRTRGVRDFAEVDAVVLETDGTFSVITTAPGKGWPETLVDVELPAELGGPLDLTLRHL
jgi:uncharacterized membrane protein YcaP (DUF421 family)